MMATAEVRRVFARGLRRPPAADSITPDVKFWNVV